MIATGTDGFIFLLMLKLPYIGLFSVLLVAGLGVPLPEDIPLLAAGWLVHKGHANLYAMIAVGMVGVLTGDLMLFSMGRKYGEHITEHRLLRRVASPALLARAERLFAQHGAKIIFVARFMPGLRSVLFLTAGIFRVRRLKFILIDGSAALASVPLLIWLGSKFGAHIERVAGDVRSAQLIAAGCLVTALASWGAWEYRQHRRRKRLAAEQEVVLLHPIPEANEVTARKADASPPRQPEAVAGGTTRAGR